MNLARTQRVIAVDLQGHGRTADIDRPFAAKRWRTISRRYSGISKFPRRTSWDTPWEDRRAPHSDSTPRDGQQARRGLSGGSAVGLVPGGARGDGAGGRWNGRGDEAEPAYQSYARIAPRPGDWPVLLDKTGALLRQDFDWTREVKSIAAPTLLVFGDADAIRPEHMVEFFHLLGGGTKMAAWTGPGCQRLGWRFCRHHALHHI